MLNLRSLFIALLLFSTLSPLYASNSDNRFSPLTFQTNSTSPLRHAPRGEIIQFFKPNTRFTSSEQRDGWIKVTGHFPDDHWEALPKPLWIHHYYADQFYAIKEPKKSKRPQGSKRMIIVDKSHFNLRVIEQLGDKEKLLFKTRVALGMDGCQPQELGGNCYYTESGQYSIRWKVEDERGIEWCIPKHMEQEFMEDIAQGNRCFRGPIGNYALNIGGSYAIHGTSNPASIGKRVSHGCIRTTNRDMKKIYSLMDVGDRVIITD